MTIFLKVQYIRNLPSPCVSSKDLRIGKDQISVTPTLVPINDVLYCPILLGVSSFYWIFPVDMIVKIIFLKHVLVVYKQKAVLGVMF